MPTRESLLMLAHAVPFRTFRIRMKDGTTYDVSHPRMIRVGCASAMIFEYSDPEMFIHDRFHLASLTLMEKIETAKINEATADKAQLVRASEGIADMSAVVEAMTSEEFFDLPDHDKFDRWLIRGELRERPMSLRSPAHANATTQITLVLGRWLTSQAGPKPKLYSGDISFRVQHDPDTNLGADVALATPEQAERTGLHDRFIEGAPFLAVEILSASDTTENVEDKIREYLDAGTPLVWIVNPFRFTITVYQPGEEPILFNRRQELTCEPLLPGLRISVGELFA